MSVSLLAWIVFLLPILLVILLAKSLSQGGSGRQFEAEEVKLVQDLHRQIQHMEQRIEALETIMFDRESVRANRDNR